jgi:NADPH2:quinone reductase
VKGCRLVGFVMFKATAQRQAAAAADINRWMTAGRLKPLIDRVLPLDRVAEAHAVQESATIHKSGTLSGKIVIEP